jgi:hypothetical protein
MSTPTDTQKELAHLARALKAPRLLAAAERLAPIARESNWSHEQYLAAVLSQEVSSRKHPVHGYGLKPLVLIA